MPLPTQRHAGQYKLKELSLTNFKGKKVDIKAALIKLDIQTDLFNNCMHGSLQLRDKANFIQNIPLIGEEILTLSIKADEESETKTFQFYVFQNEDVEIQGKDTFIYTLYFSSIELLSNRSLSVSEGFKNINTTQLIQKMFDRISTKQLNTENTSNSISYIAPNISPLEIINYVCARSISNKTPNSAVYVFYEDLNGFNFKTIDSLMMQKPKFLYGFQHKSESNTDFSFEYYSINGWKVEQHYNILDNINKGMYGSTVYSLDPFTREYKKYVYNYFSNTDYMKTNHIESSNPKNKLHTQNFLFKNVADNYNKFGMVGSHQQGKLEKLGIRYSQINQLTNSYKLILEIPGNSNLYAGDVITVDFLNYSSDNDKEKKDLYVKGNYIVMATRHIFTQVEYQTVVEVVKDSFYNDHEKYDRTGMVI